MTVPLSHTPRDGDSGTAAVPVPLSQLSHVSQLSQACAVSSPHFGGEHHA
jgi:hypothetical protein